MSRETHKRKYYLDEEESASEDEVAQLWWPPEWVRGYVNTIFAEFPLFQLPKQVFIYIFASYLTAQDFLLFRRLNKTIQAKLENTLIELYFQKKISTVFPGNYPETKVTAIDRYKNLIESVLNLSNDNTARYRKIFNYIAENDSNLAMKELQRLVLDKTRVLEWQDRLCIDCQTSTGISLINWAVKFSRQEFLDSFFKFICDPYFFNHKKYENLRILIDAQFVEDLKTEMAASGMSNSALSTYSLAFVCLQKSICEEMKKFINWDTSYVDKSGCSLLTYAVLLRSPELFSHVIKDLSEEKTRYLLSTRANLIGSVVIDFEDDDCLANPLELACFLDVSADFMKLILSFNGGIERCKSDELGEYLHWCISKRNLEAVMSLLMKGVDPNTVTRFSLNEVSCLVKAVQVKSLPILKLLLNYNAHIPADGECKVGQCNDPLTRAVEKLSVDAVSFLLERGASVNGHQQCDRGYNLIEKAMLDSEDPQSRLAVVKLLAAKKPENIDRAISSAIDRGDFLIAKFLSTISPVNYEHFRRAAQHSFPMLVLITSGLPRSTIITWLHVVWCEAMIAHSCALILCRGGDASPFLDQLKIMQDFGVIRKSDDGQFITSKLTEIFYNDDNDDARPRRAFERGRYHLFLRSVHRLGTEAGVDSTKLLETLPFFKSTQPRWPWIFKPINLSAGVSRPGP